MMSEMLAIGMSFASQISEGHNDFKQRIEQLQNQLRVVRAMEPKQLWTSNILEPLIHPTMGIVIGHKIVKVQGAYNYSLHGELGVN